MFLSAEELEDTGEILPANTARRMLEDVQRAPCFTESGRLGRAQLRALQEGRIWPHADFGGTGTNSGCVGMRRDASWMRPGCVLDASGCVGMRRDFDFRHKMRQNSGKFRQHWGNI